MADLGHEYFRDADAVLAELERVREVRARTAQSEEGAEFDTVHHPDGRISKQGYVITGDDIVGVWVELDDVGYNYETTFYAARPGGTLAVEEFRDTAWSITDVKDRARQWLTELWT